MFMGSVSVQCRNFSNIILSQFLLILGPKNILFSCGCGVAWFGFCFVSFMTSAETGKRNYFIILINSPCSLHLGYLCCAFVEIGMQ